MNTTARLLADDELVFSDGFVLNPDPFYSPSYRISPFRTLDIADNFGLPRSDAAIATLDHRFQDRKWCFTECGKEAIALALEALELKSDDCVTIMTTSDNFYISGCVTREIEKVCLWSREIESNTAAIFVNHEFGYPRRDLSALRKYGVPIIEDACHSYLADTPAGDMGKVGDFIVFSLPKIFPLQLGGVLAYHPRYAIRSKVSHGSELASFLIAVVSHYSPSLDAAKAARISNHHELSRRFATFGCHPRFELLENDVPGVFIFSTPTGTDMPAMKAHGRRHGIECSVFYGEEAFFIPVHQRLRTQDLDYFTSVFSRFLNR